jgi:hypothetical protein
MQNVLILGYPRGCSARDRANLRHEFTSIEWLGSRNRAQPLKRRDVFQLDAVD